jgi:hypothetical protein
MREIHIFLEKVQKIRDQLEDTCVVREMIKNNRDRKISLLRLRLLASQKENANPQC